MALRSKHREAHRTERVGWLRAAVLGANDGIVSISSLILGVSAAQSSRESILIAGAAGVVAGAMSMAAGEYVSVSSQKDSEQADLKREKAELESDYDEELKELSEIYQGRGVEPALAREVAKQMMNFDALGAHARDELGLIEELQARPLQAAASSALAFSLGGISPLLLTLITPLEFVLPVVGLGSLILLWGLGVLSAWAGGAKMTLASVRIVFWGAMAMLLTMFIGKLFGIA